VRRGISAQSFQARRDRLPRWVTVRAPVLHGENVGNATASRRTLEVSRPRRHGDVMTAPNLLESSEQEELYLRGSDTLLASWEEYARGADGAAVHRLPGVATAVFPAEPERAVYNNALLECDMGPGERSDALDAMETVY